MLTCCTETKVPLTHTIFLDSRPQSRAVMRTWREEVGRFRISGGTPLVDWVGQKGGMLQNFKTVF